MGKILLKICWNRPCFSWARFSWARIVLPLGVCHLEYSVILSGREIIEFRKLCSNPTNLQLGEVSHVQKFLPENRCCLHLVELIVWKNLPRSCDKSNSGGWGGECECVCVREGSPALEHPEEAKAGRADAWLVSLHNLAVNCFLVISVFDFCYTHQDYFATHRGWHCSAQQPT